MMALTCTLLFIFYIYKEKTWNTGNKVLKHCLCCCCFIAVCSWLFICIFNSRNVFAVFWHCTYTCQHCISTTKPTKKCCNGYVKAFCKVTATAKLVPAISQQQCYDAWESTARSKFFTVATLNIPKHFWSPATALHRHVTSLRQMQNYWAICKATLLQLHAIYMEHIFKTFVTVQLQAQCDCPTSLLPKCINDLGAISI